MNIILGNDHGAIELKKQIMNFLKDKGHSIKNIGIDTGETADYPDIAEKTCIEFKNGNYDFGILFCGTGIGISIAANKIEGIRCALPQNLFAAEMSKAHNNANFLSFGGRIEYPDSVEAMIEKFINTEHGEDRHVRRVKKIMDLESN